MKKAIKRTDSKKKNAEATFETRSPIMIPIKSNAAELKRNDR